MVEADALKNHEFLKKGRMTKDRHKALDDDPVFRKLVHEYSTQV